MADVSLLLYYRENVSRTISKFDKKVLFLQLEEKEIAGKNQI